MEQYRLLNETTETILENYESSYSLVEQYNKEDAISRTDVIKEFGGENLKKILEELNFSGDVQEGIDFLVHDILLFAGDYSEHDSIIDEIDCDLHAAKCRKDGGKRKLCDKREYTTDCKTLILRKA